MLPSGAAAVGSGLTRLSGPTTGVGPAPLTGSLAATSLSRAGLVAGSRLAGRRRAGGWTLTAEDALLAWLPLPASGAWLGHVTGTRPVATA